MERPTRWQRAKQAARDISAVVAAATTLSYIPACKDKPTMSLDQRATMMAEPLIRRYAAQQERPYDSLKQRVFLDGDSTGAQVLVYYKNQLVTGVYTDFKKDSAYYMGH